jgi:putative hemolysin
VLDEFGGVQGVATVDDILEALVGELPELGDADGPEIAKQPDGSWIVHGGVALEDLEATLDLDPLPHEQRRGFRTAAGLVIARLGRIPVDGDAVDFDTTRIEVVEMDGRRIARVRVRRRPHENAPPGA